MPNKEHSLLRKLGFNTKEWEPKPNTQEARRAVRLFCEDEDCLFEQPEFAFETTIQTLGDPVFIFSRTMSGGEKLYTSYHGRIPEQFLQELTSIEIAAILDDNEWAPEIRQCY